jgi:hypothetical protein
VLTANAQANQNGVTYKAQVIPVIAEIKCPQKNDQGWANGLSGANNKITTDAPIDASNTGELGAKYAELLTITKTQKKLDVIKITPSLKVKLPAGGMNCVKFAKEKIDIFFQDKNASV